MSLILPIVVLGLMASLSPATIVVFVLVLGTARARANAAAFLTGWMLSLTLVFAGSFVVAASGATETQGGRASIAAVEILLGTVLVALGVRTWRRRGDPPPPDEPSTWVSARFEERLRRLTPVGAVVVGVLKQPWAITSAAALVVVHSRTTGPLVVLAFAVFTIASTATVGVMFVFYARNPDEARARLATLRDQAVALGPALGASTGILVGGFLVVHSLVNLR